MSIYEQVLTFIHRPESEEFQRLALDVFRHQFETVGAYRIVLPGARDRGLAPSATLTTFRRSAMSRSSTADLAADGAARAPGAAIFLTSGTTQGRERRGRHIVARPEIYRASAISHLRKMLFPDARRMAILAMHPTADAMPESSLSAMITWSIEEFATPTHLAAASRDKCRYRSGDGVSCRCRSTSRTGLHHGHDGGIRGAVLCAERRGHQTSTRAGFAHDGHRWRERAGRADARRRR